MTKENLIYQNGKKLEIIKKVCTRVADKLVNSNEMVTNQLDKNNIEFIINSGINDKFNKEVL